MRRFLIAITLMLLVEPLAHAAVTDAPKITRNFLSFCTKNVDDCDDAIVAVHISDVIARKVAYCYPKTKTTEELKAMLGRVKSWLTKRPDLYPQSTSVSIRAAFQALFPCRRP
jgi:hypothetical protein